MFVWVSVCVVVRGGVHMRLRRWSNAFLIMCIWIPVYLIGWLLIYVVACLSAHAYLYGRAMVQKDIRVCVCVCRCVCA